MRIGVDATCWANHRGYGRYARELVRAMVAAAPDDAFTCYLDQRALDGFDLGDARVRPVVVPQSASPTTAASAAGYRSPADLLRFTRAVWRDRPDVFFSPSVYTYFPLPPRQRAVVTIHDAIAERFPTLTLPSMRARWFWRWKVQLAVRQATRILTVSDFSRDDLVRHLGLAGDRIRVTGEAPAAAYRPSGPEEIRTAAGRFDLPEGRPWFAYVGGFNPHKNVDLLVRAHAAASRGRPEPPLLLLIGAEDEVFHQALDAIRGAIAAEGTTPLVRWLGYVPDDELRPLLAGAVALVLPSECEGFGLPAVEAAACGTPVVATRESPLPALLEGGGLFVRPGDLSGLAAALGRLLDEPLVRCELGRAALTRARALSWDRAAGVALTALREAAA